MCAARRAIPNPPPPAAGAARGGGGGGGLTVQGLPLVKPPYGRDHGARSEQGRACVWQIAHGETPDNIKNHPALKGLTIPRTGRHGPHRHAGDEDAGHCGRRRLLHDARRQRGAMLRAYDKATGEEVGAVSMPAPQTGRR